VLFATDYSKDIHISENVLLTAEDTSYPMGAGNYAKCSDTLKLFSLSKVEAGPTLSTLFVSATYVDQRTIAGACASNEKVKNGVVPIAPGVEKEGRFIFDLSTRKIVGAALIDGKNSSAITQTAPTIIAMAPTQSDIKSSSKSVTPTIDTADLARLLQFHLKRVGCDPGDIEGTWSEGSRNALEKFNRLAGTKFDVKVATIDALDAVKAKTARICPLVCGPGYRVEDDRCVPERKAASRPKKTSEGRPTDTAREPEIGQGQVYCTNAGGCRPVPKNCRIVSPHGAGAAVEGNLFGQQIDCN
jgi:hypothetical protein